LSTPWDGVGIEMRDARLLLFMNEGLTHEPKQKSDALALGLADGVPGNSTWSSGDWNGDGEFNSSDLMFLMREGGYEGASRTIVNAVPEPSTLAWVSVSMGLLRPRRRRSSLRRVSPREHACVGRCLVSDC
jgi:hypothetical protein